MTIIVQKPYRMAYYYCVSQLQVRKQHGYTPNVSLDRARRRPIVSQISLQGFSGLTSLFKIRLCILQGDTVQEWLQDGALYGEEGPILTLDSLMIQVAALRYPFNWRSLRVFGRG